MESGPSKIAETLVYWLLPPACREEILGDMRERNRTTVQFLLEATHTVPSVIYSRISRTTDAVVVLTEAVSLYTAFVLSAFSFDRELLLREYAFARLALPPAIFLAAIILAGAYSDPKKRWPQKPLFAPVLGFALTAAVQLNHNWSLPVPVLAWGGALSVLIASTLRLTFPPITERPQPAKIPAYWQKLDLSLPSFTLKSALLVCALAIILFLLAIHR